jgi:N-acetylneuraminic acid mutarotase
MKSIVWLIAGLLAAGMAIAPAAAQDGKWRMATPMPSPQGEITSAVIGKKWYVFGGYDGPNVQARGIVTVYDAATDTWTNKQNMLIPAHHAAAVALDGKIYVFGGFVGRPGTKVWQPIPSSVVYDPDTDSWKELAPMPTPRGSAVAVAVNGKIYVIGGAHANIPGKPPTEPLWVGVPTIVTGTVEEYDPATNTWRARAPMPTGRNHFMASVVDGKIYAIDGRLGMPFVTMSDVTDLVEMYDPATDVWTYKSRSPTRRGENPEGKLAFWAFEAYDPKTNTWQTLPHLQIARHGFVANFIDNEFHAAGGSFQSDGEPGIFSQMATHEVFTVAK